MIRTELSQFLPRGFRWSEKAEKKKRRARLGEGLRVLGEAEVRDDDVTIARRPRE